MPHRYTCPTCHADKYLDGSLPRPVMQQRCETPRCFGRLDWVSSTPGPRPPPLPAALTAGDIATATTPVVINRAGSFCAYSLTFNRRDWTIDFAGNSAGRAYALQLNTDIDGNSRRYFEPPKHQRPGEAATPVSEFFVFNPRGAKDWIFPPDPLPENRTGGPRRNELVSYGHGPGMRLPIRLRIGRQDEDDEHSGSGLIHMMFAHQKDDLQAVYDVLNAMLLPSRIGAIYRTRVEQYGHHRFFFLSRSATPNCLVTEQNEAYQRVITLYKITGFSNYNKFARNLDEYVCIYRWDREKF